MPTPTPATAFARTRRRHGDPARCARRALIGVATGAAVVIAVVMAMAGGAAVLADDQPWQGALRQQLQSQYGCRLERFVFAREVPLGAEITREGRVRCLDGREVDYEQPNVLLKFKLHLCGPTAC